MATGYKILLVADDTPEFPAAILYAALRAKALSAAVAILCVVDGGAELSYWVTVGQEMRAEAQERAEAIAAAAAQTVQAETGAAAEVLLREGDLRAALRRALDEDPAIKALVIAAGAGRDGPGPLVSAVGRGALGGRPVPVVIVPGGLPPEDIRRLAEFGPA